MRSSKVSGRLRKGSPHVLAREKVMGVLLYQRDIANKGRNRVDPSGSDAIHRRKTKTGGIAGGSVGTPKERFKA